jgi:hypothetical protein
VTAETITEPGVSRRRALCGLVVAPAAPGVLAACSSSGGGAGAPAPARTGLTPVSTRVANGAVQFA